MTSRGVECIGSSIRVDSAGWQTLIHLYNGTSNMTGFSRIGTLLGLSWLLCCTGCNIVMPIMFIADPKQKVTAEFDKLPGSRVVVLIDTDQSTRFDYPHARLELATHLSDKLKTELTQREAGTDMVTPRDVEDFLQKNPSAQVDTTRVGRQFKADFVIFVEVYEFQFRSPEHPQLLQGRINASVTVHDTRLSEKQTPRFALAPVTCMYPEGGPILMNATNSLSIREATYQLFAEKVAKKFYEHTAEN